MNLRRLTVLGAAGVVLTATAANAHVVVERRTAAASCTFDACAVRAEHQVHSDPQRHCGYRDFAGQWQFVCDVWHGCFAVFTGILPNGTVTCSDVATLRTCSGVTECSIQIGAWVPVAGGSCKTFVASASVSQVGGVATATPGSVNVCVDQAGPYVP